MKNERTVSIKIAIKNGLLYILKDAKKGYIGQAKAGCSELTGIIRYMSLVDDIDEETYQKIYKLIWTIRKKYHIY